MTDNALVTLREITADTVRTITALEVAPTQRHFVATNAESLAQALFHREAWYRAVYHGDTPVGFVMLHDESLAAVPPATPRLSVWRFMIDARHQGHGFGAAALQRVIEHAEHSGRFATLYLSVVPGSGSAKSFYARAGFVPTGVWDEGEMEMARPLAAPGAGGLRTG